MHTSKAVNYLFADNKMIEFWFDPHHTGALRVIDYNSKTIYGSDPKEPHWKCAFKCLSSDSILVDFTTKQTHRGKKQMIATYKSRRNKLVWPDTNVWLRVRYDPRILLRETFKY